MSSPASNAAMIKAMPAVFVLIWSTGFIVAKYGLPYAPPMSFLAIRYLLSLLCFFAWIALARVAWPASRSQWLHLGVTGILIHAGYLGGVWSAIKGGMGSGLSALVVGLQPVLTAVWVTQMGDSSRSENRVSARQWLGLVLGLAGLLLVVSRKFGAGNEATFFTLGCAVFALLSITAGTLYQKRFVLPADVRSANAIQLGAALLVTLPLAWLETEAVQWTPGFMGALAWSVLALTLGGSSLLYMLIQRGAATAVTSLLYLVPPTTALMAWLLFGEAITLVTVAGTALTALGVSLVVRPARPPQH
ncbi:MAG TPA: DMT family transporter [Polaromonas sp.]|uniref:DMT family transporter n=1 Tax=Polaromonas sp. TaxID=1869339 RepID=UPI002D75CFF2|nr:DMT family transporter [Polaromonas sp.]HYW57982.1 DMT family transporter [Polaromonas sp.]